MAKRLIKRVLGMCCILTIITVSIDIFMTAKSYIITINRATPVTVLRGVPRPVDAGPGFQTVGDVHPNLYVYSAIRKNHDIRIVAIKQYRVTVDNLLCVVWDENDRNISGVMEATVTNIYGQIPLKYVAAYVTCHSDRRYKDIRYVDVLPRGWSSRSAAVWVDLIKKDGNGTILASLPVEGDFPRWEDAASVSSKNTPYHDMVEFTVCVPPMHGNYSNVAQVVEKLEMSRLLGAGRVVFYITSVSAEVEAVIRWYQQRSNKWDEKAKETRLLVEVRWWILPLELDIRSGGQFKWRKQIIHYKGQIATLDDCLNLYRWRSRYLVFTDLDEFIIPFHHSNWSQLIAHRKKVRPNAKAHLLRHSAFITQNQSAAEGFKDEAKKYKSVILGYTKRDDFIFPRIIRSKCIVDPRYVDDMGVHLVRYPGKLMEDVPIGEALLYHYRNGKIRGGYPQVDDHRPSDIFGKRLAVRLKIIWSSIRNIL